MALSDCCPRTSLDESESCHLTALCGFLICLTIFWASRNVQRTKCWHREFNFFTTQFKRKYFPFFVLSLFHLSHDRKQTTCFFLVHLLPATQAHPRDLYRGLFLSPCGLPHSSSINERGHCWATQAILSTKIQWSTHMTQGSAVQQIRLWLRREWSVLKAWHSTTSCRDTMQAPQSNTTRLALPLARAN